MAHFVKASLTQKSSKAKAKDNAAKLSKIYTAKSPLPAYMSQQLIAAQSQINASPTRIMKNPSSRSEHPSKFNNRNSSSMLYLHESEAASAGPIGKLYHTS